LLHHQQDEAVEGEEDSLLAELRNLATAVARVSGRAAETAGSQRSPSPEATPAAARRRAAGFTAVEADPGLLGRLGAVAAACRQSRRPLSLLLVQLDHSEELPVGQGVEGLGKLVQLLESLCRRIDHPCALCLAYGEMGFAVILPSCERRLAVELGSQLIEQFRRSGAVGQTNRATTEQGTDGHRSEAPVVSVPKHSRSGRRDAASAALAPKHDRVGRPAVSISVGAATVALPPKNFPPEDLLAAAERCLYGSAASGGNVVKSIEIY
jgi:GGDEF domain-containing protein